jgi:hypothetical protein
MQLRLQDSFVWMWIGFDNQLLPIRTENTLPVIKYVKIISQKEWGATYEKNEM